MTPQRGLWPWLFQRITGAFLIFGMTLHIVATHLQVHDITFENVSARLHSGWWVLFDLLLLSACFYHGFNGVWSVVVDFNPPVIWRRVAGWFLALFGLLWVGYGILTLVPFTR